MTLPGFDDWISREPEYVAEFTEGDLVMVRYPAERYIRPDGITDLESIARLRELSESWPWMLGTITHCGDGEYQVTVEDERVSERSDGSPAGPEVPAEHRYHPVCFRTDEEIRELTPEEVMQAEAEAEL